MQGNNINPNGTGATLAAPASQYQGRAGLSPAFMKPYTRKKVTVRTVSSTPSTNRAQWDCTHGLAEEATGMEKAWGAGELAPERCRCASLPSPSSVFSQHSSGYPLSMFVGACSDISKHHFG